MEDFPSFVVNPPTFRIFLAFSEIHLISFLPNSTAFLISLVFLRPIFLAIKVSGNFDRSIQTFQEASEVFQDLGKLRKVKEINKEISRLEEFSREMVEDEYMLHKFNVDKY